MPPAPAQIADDQKNDTRPVYVATESEDDHERQIDDLIDWGDRRNLLAFRWCKLWNRFAAQQEDCGADPSQ